MAALDFPSSPSLNQRYTANNATWQWNGSAWIRLADPGPRDIITTAQDTSTNPLYPILAAGVGADQTPKVTTGKLSFNASSGALTATSFVGDGSNLTGIDATAIQTGTTKVQTAAKSILNQVSGVGIVTVQPSGLTATGISTFTEIRLLDSAKIQLGNNQDLQFYHDGSKSVIADTGTGGLFIAGSSISLTDAGITETMLYAVPNGAVELNYDNSKKFETTSTGSKSTGRIDPAADSTHDLGTTSVRWRNVYADTLYGSGANLTGITAGYWGQDSVGLNTNTSAGINTSTINDKDLTGIGNSFRGMYISNGMMIMDNVLNGNHYIGTAFNGLMAGPVTIDGTLSVDGQYVVV